MGEDQTVSAVGNHSDSFVGFQVTEFPDALGGFRNHPGNAAAHPAGNVIQCCHNNPFSAFLRKDRGFDKKMNEQQFFLLPLFRT
jgi:hypothetical protein